MVEQGGEIVVAGLRSDRSTGAVCCGHRGVPGATRVPGDVDAIEAGRGGTVLDDPAKARGPIRSSEMKPGRQTRVKSAPTRQGRIPSHPSRARIGSVSGLSPRAILTV